MRGIIIGGGAVPALDLNFASLLAIPAIGTFSRGSIGSYFDNAGLYKTALSGVPRFTYDPITHAPLGFLSELGSTNIQLHSALDSGWGVTNGALVAANATGPDGTLDAGTFTENTAGGQRELFLTASTVITANTVYTGSIFLKAGTCSTVAVRWEISGRASGISANVDLNAGTISAAITYGTGTSAAVPAIQALPNGWYRVFLAGTVDATSTAAFLVAGAQNPLGTDSYTGTSRTFFAWGADIKSGIDYSSHIPTTTGSAARSSDALSIPISSFPYNPNAGTLVASFGYLGQPLTGFSRVASLVGATPNTDETSIYIQQSNGAIQGANTVAGTNLNKDSGLTIPLLGSAITAYAFNGSRMSISVNGSTAVAQANTNAALPTVTSLLVFGAARFQNPPSGYMKRLRYFPNVQSDAFLKRLSAGG